MGMETVLAINFKMPTIVGILKFMSRKVTLISVLSKKMVHMVLYFIKFMKITSFTLIWAKHEKCSITVFIAESWLPPRSKRHVGYQEHYESIP